MNTLARHSTQALTIQISKFKHIGFEKMADFDGGQIRKCIFNY